MAEITKSDVNFGIKNNSFISPTYIKNAPKNITKSEYKKAVELDKNNDGVVDYKKIIDMKKAQQIINGINEYVLAEKGNNASKYREWFYGSDREGVDWCAIFVNWIFNRGGESKLYVMPNKDSGFAGEGIDESIKAGYGKWYEDENTDPKTTPRAGDVVGFTRGMNPDSKAPWGYDESGNIKKWKWITPYGSDHVGYVYKVDDKKIYTIEGNAGSGGADDTVVTLKEYDRKDININGYYRPNYENANNEGLSIQREKIE